MARKILMLKTMTNEGRRFTMASVNWMKMTNQKAGAMFRHLDTNSRQQHCHANQHINKEMSKYNYIVGAESYAETLKRMKQRVKDVDSVLPPKRKKKDRITSIMLEFTCPAELTDQYKKFFQVMYEAAVAYFEQENVHGMYVHLDEIHDYIDYRDGTLRTSLPHAHLVITPYTKEHGVNAKNFVTRERLTEYNNIVNYVIEKMFGIKYNTGKGKNYETVETMKQKSEEMKQQIQKQRVR